MAQMLSQGISPSQSLAYATREKVVFFIHTILTTIISKVDNSRAIYFQNQLFRLFAFDKNAGVKFNFKELTKKVSVDNAMLKVLDGYLNVNGNPQENFARELHELYTIGRGLEGVFVPPSIPYDYGVYKELDVQEAARVLSGWDIDFGFEKDPQTGEFLNIDIDTKLPRGKVKGSKTNASSHDNSLKQFSDRFASKTVKPDPLLLNGGNATEASALDEISQLIEQIYAQPETALNICRRIYRFYVYHSINKPLDDSIITNMATTFQNSGFKLQAVLEDLFQSQHFYDAAGGVDDDNFGGIIKSPLDLVIGTLRFFNVQLPSYQTSATNFYEKMGGLLRAMSLMGMPFYNPFDVAGHDAYHQYPIYHRSWISTNYLAQRYNFIRGLIKNPDPLAPPPKSDAVLIDAYDFVKTKINNAIASDAELLIKELANYLLPLGHSGLTPARSKYFLKAFLGIIDGEDPTLATTAWTTRWNNNLDMETVKNQLARLFNAMMQSPEYQLY
jgi:uncharacterized protein (DUF1800 family)